MPLLALPAPPGLGLDGPPAVRPGGLVEADTALRRVFAAARGVVAARLARRDRAGASTRARLLRLVLAIVLAGLRRRSAVVSAGRLLPRLVDKPLQQ
eukprot:15480004-Alexandrium_andersonii.AAC.1